MSVLEKADMFPGTLGNSSHVHQMRWGIGTVSHVPQKNNYLGNMGTVFPMFLKRIWGIGTVPHVTQKYLGNRNSSPYSSKY